MPEQIRYVFVHDKPDWLLAAILIMLGMRGNVCTVIGCTDYEGVGGCDEAVAFDDLYSDVEGINCFRIFRDCYHTPTVNDTLYERLCFERWFYLYAYASQKRCPLIYLDSDYLLSPNFSSQCLPFGLSRFYDTPFINSLTDLSGLFSFLEFIAEVQKDKETAFSLSSKYSVSGRPHLSDMNCLMEHGIRSPDLCSPLANAMLQHGLCPNISISGDYETEGPIRRILTDAARASFICISKNDGRSRPFYSVHLQGLSKALAPLFMSPLILAERVWNEKSLYELYLQSLANRDGYWVTDLGVSMLGLLGLWPSSQPSPAQSIPSLRRKFSLHGL